MQVIIAVARGVSLAAGDGDAAEALATAGRAALEAAAVRFQVEARLRRGFTRVKI